MQARLAFVLLLLLLAEAFEKLLLAHVHFSCQVHDRAVDGLNEAVEPLDFLLKYATMRLQRRQQVEIRAVEDFPDLEQLQPYFAVEQDLLKPQHRVLVVMTVAVFADRRRLEQPDLVVIMQRAHADSRQIGQLFDGVHVIHSSNPLQHKLSRNVRVKG